MQLTTGQVIRWWEFRRLPYNAALLAVGLFSIVGFEWLMNKVIPLGEDAIEPFALILGVFAYGLMANICYTLGWVYELYMRTIDTKAARIQSYRLFRLGFTAACVLTSAPLWYACLFYLLHRPTH